MKSYDIYLASPLFCAEDNAVLDAIEAKLDHLGVSYFSPRHGCKIDLSACKTKEDKDAAAQEIFEKNESAIKASKLVFVNTIGTLFNNAVYADAGTMVEAGMAFATDTPVFTYNFKGYGLNIMLSQKAIRHNSELSLEDETSLDSLDIIPYIISDIDEGMNPEELRNKYFDLIEGDLY